jgi:hypothetical protein
VRWRKRISRKAAATAEVKLEKALQQIKRFQEIERTAEIQVYHLEYRERRRVEEAQAKGKLERQPLYDSLLRQAGEIAQLLRNVHVRGFYEHSPESGHDPVQRAIGIYAGIAAGGPQPKPPPPSQSSSPAGATSTRGWWSSPVALALIGALGGALAGSATGYFTAFYGVKQTCLPGDEKPCEPRDGLPYVHLCRADGHGYDDCRPLAGVTATQTPAPRAPSAASPPPSNAAAANDGGGQ